MNEKQYSQEDLQSHYLYLLGKKIANEKEIARLAKKNDNSRWFANFLSIIQIALLVLIAYNTSF